MKSYASAIIFALAVSTTNGVTIKQEMSKKQVETQQEGGEVDVGTELAQEGEAVDSSCYIRMDVRPHTGMPGTCPPELDGESIGFCYDKHSDEYECTGPFCLQKDCPPGFTDTGVG